MQEQYLANLPVDLGGAYIIIIVIIIVIIVVAVVVVVIVMINNSMFSSRFSDHSEGPSLYIASLLQVLNQARRNLRLPRRCRSN